MAVFEHLFEHLFDFAPFFEGEGGENIRENKGLVCRRRLLDNSNSDAEKHCVGNRKNTQAGVAEKRTLDTTSEQPNERHDHPGTAQKNLPRRRPSRPFGRRIQERSTAKSTPEKHRDCTQISASPDRENRVKFPSKNCKHMAKKKPKKISNSNPLSVSLATGYFENDTTRAYRLKVCERMPQPHRLPWNFMAPAVFLLVMTHAAHNRTTGDYNSDRYSTIDAWHELIFVPKFVSTWGASAIPTLDESKILLQCLKETFTDENGTIHQFKDYNPHIFKAKETVAKRRKAGKKSGEARDKLRQIGLDDKVKAKGKAKPAEKDPIEARGKKLKSAPAEKIEWDGKLWFPPDLRKAIADLESEVAKKVAKLKKTDPGDESHNIWFSQLLELDKQLASAKSALLRTKIDPPARRKPQPARPAPAKRGDPDAAAKAFEDFKRTKEEIAAA